jgi:hypothetical protein
MGQENNRLQQAQNFFGALVSHPVCFFPQEEVCSLVGVTAPYRQFTPVILADGRDLS